MRAYTLLAAAALCVCAPSGADAAIERRIHFQGRLGDAYGQPITQPSGIPMTLTVFTSASGVESCHGESLVVPVRAGYFEVDLGDGASVGSCNFAVPYFLELQVGGDPLPMRPRIPIAAVPYAFLADRLYVAPDQAWPAGNAASNVPLINTVLNVGLNADIWDGHHWPDINIPIYECGQGTGQLSSVSPCIHKTHGAKMCAESCCADAIPPPPPPDAGPPDAGPPCDSSFCDAGSHGGDGGGGGGGGGPPPPDPPPPPPGGGGGASGATLDQAPPCPYACVEIDHECVEIESCNGIGWTSLRGFHDQRTCLCYPADYGLIYGLLRPSGP